MTLTDPREALADQSNFISCLVGMAALSRVVHGLAEGERSIDPRCDADDFVHVLLGVASLGEAVERLAQCRPEQEPPADASETESAYTRWLR